MTARIPLPRRSRLLTALPTLLAVTLLVVAGRWFVGRWEVFMGDGSWPSVAAPWIVLSGALLTVHAFIALASWRAVMRAVGADLSLHSAADVFIPSLLARYVPGKVWANTLRIALARRLGVGYGASTGAILWETLIALGSAGVIAIVTLTGNGSRESTTAAVLLVTISLSIWLIARASLHVRVASGLVARFASTRLLKEPSTVLAPLLFSLLGWFVYGAAHIAIALSLTSIAPDESLLVVGSVALAWAGGYLAIVVPVGLGIRDGILLVTLASVLDPPLALLFVALSRAVQLAVDLLVTAGWVILRAGRSAPPLPSDESATLHPPAAGD